MPIPESRLYNPNKLNRWFAISSVLMTASIFWMIWVDYDRPWRAFQERYFDAKAAVAHLDYLDAMLPEYDDKLREAEYQLASAEEYAKPDAGQLEKLEKQFEIADLAFRIANNKYSGAFQELEVTRSTYETTLGEHGAGHARTEAAHAQFREEEALVESLRKDKEVFEDQRDELESQIRTLTAKVRAAKKHVAELEELRASALLRDQQLRGVLPSDDEGGRLPLVKAIIHAPLGDFTAPKTTPGRQQVRQLVLPDVRQQLNYLESYTTDRCTTCHIAIDDPAFAEERLASRLERALPSINEALSRKGRDLINPPEPPVLASGTRLPAGGVSEHWDDLAQEQRSEYLTALLDLVNGYMEVCDREPIEIGQPILAHPDFDLYVSIDSPHPANKVGCTVCHEGNPQETDFVQAAHSPPTHEIEEAWKNEYYITRLGIPNVTFETVAHYWDRPMRLPQYTEAGCAKCHSEITDIALFEGKRHGGRINLGRYLFTQVGCINCHNIKELAGARRVGPDLRHIAAKLEPEFVQPWIYSPQSFRPSTRMPHFFMQENNRDQGANNFDPEPVLRTETEVAAVSRYLFALSDDWKPVTKPADTVGDPTRGRELFKQFGCLGCHGNIAEYGQEWITKDLMQREGLDEQTAFHRYKGMTYEQRVQYASDRFPTDTDTIFDPDATRFDPEDLDKPPVFTRFAPDLSGIGSKVTADWLYSWLINPAHYSATTKMPSMRLLPSEAADIASYLMTLENNAFVQGEFEMTPERHAMAEELIFTLLSAQKSERRSMAIVQDVGGELTSMLVSLLTRTLGKDAAYDLVSGMTLEDKQLLYLGNKTISHYGCYACHEIRGFEGATPPGTDLSTWAEKPVAQLDFANYNHAFHDMRHDQPDVYGFVYPRDAWDLNRRSPTPDDLQEQITHTHAAFAKHKMLNPRIWDREKLKRPYDKLKMPNFYFTEKEAEALTTFLLSRASARVNDSLKVDYAGSTLGPIARGRHLTRELNCNGCHQLEDNAPTIQQYFARDVSGTILFDEANAPPRLWGEGAKVQPDWLHGFFGNVEPLRPWLQVRMPSFNLTSEQATTLVAYFAALSQRDAMKLNESLAPVAEAIEAERARGDEEWAETWFEKSLLADAAGRLRWFSVDRKLMRARDFDVLAQSPERVREAHAKLLNRAEFMQSLFDIEYPFGEPPLTISPDERFERGSFLFNDMGCLKCHVFGKMLEGPAANTDQFVQTYRLDAVRGEGDDAIVILNGKPYPIGAVIDGHTLISAQNLRYAGGDVETTAVIEGPGPVGINERVQLLAASAPNLALSYKRLRRDWVQGWMLEPALIQPDTKMPQNFAGGVSPFLGDPAYPGTSTDHLELLADHLYEAGAMGLRAPLLKIVIDDSEEEFDEDGEGGDDEFDEEEEFD